MKSMFEEAKEGRYAIMAFNYSDMWDLWAIERAARETRSPVIFSCYTAMYQELGVDWFAGLGEALMKRGERFYHHQDHSHDPELCRQAAELGFASVMFDGSALPFEENVRLTRLAADYAHSRGALIEGELGRVGGRGAQGGGSSGLVAVESVAEFVERTGVDLLAIGIGTAHGFYTEKPKIDFKRLEDVAGRVSIPLVMHGGTGIPDEDVARAIQLGIRKLNVGTIVHHTYLKSLRQSLETAGDNPYTLDVMKKVQEPILDVLRHYLRLSGSMGKLSGII